MGASFLGGAASEACLEIVGVAYQGGAPWAAFRGGAGAGLHGEGVLRGDLHAAAAGAAFHEVAVGSASRFGEAYLDHIRHPSSEEAGAYILEEASQIAGEAFHAPSWVADCEVETHQETLAKSQEVYFVLARD